MRCAKRCVCVKGVLPHGLNAAMVSGRRAIERKAERMSKSRRPRRRAGDACTEKVNAKHSGLGLMPRTVLKCFVCEGRWFRILADADVRAAKDFDDARCVSEPVWQGVEKCRHESWWVDSGRQPACRRVHRCWRRFQWLSATLRPCSG